MSGPVSRRQLREQLGPNPALDDYADARTALIIAAVNLANAVLYGRHERARELAGLVTQCSDRMSTLTLTGPKVPPTAAEGATQQKIADQFNVSRGRVAHIVSGVLPRHQKGSVR